MEGTEHSVWCLQGSSTDRAASEAYRLERLGENDIAAPPRQSLEGGSSSFAALFGSSAQPHPFAGSLARRDSQSSHISSRPDDLGLNLDLPGLQVVHTSVLHCPLHHHQTSASLLISDERRAAGISAKVVLA